jgi:uncharacterized protein (TIGR02466 family)
VAPNFTQAWIDLGLAELKLGRIQQSVVSLQQATIQQPQSALAWHGLGNAQKECDVLEAAEQSYRKAISLDSQYASAWVNLGIVQRFLGRSDEALHAFESARQCGFNSPQLADATLGAMLDTGRADLALKQAQQLVDAYPDFVSGHNSLANILWEYGPALAPTDDPLAAFKMAALKQPQHIELQLSYAAFLIKAQQGAAALEHIQAHVDHQDQPVVMRLQANALEQLGEQDKASQLLTRIYQLVGTSDVAFMNAYTRHLLKVGHLDAASKYALETIQTHSFNQEAWAYLSTIWRLQGDSREYWLCDYERLITLQDIELPSGYADMATFLQTLRETLEQIHTASRAPVQQSLREGSQTPGRLFGRNSAVLNDIQQALQSTIEVWISRLPTDMQHPFLGRKSRSVRFNGSWSVKLWSSGRHVNHIHPQGWMSSAFYVALPESVVSAESDNTAGYIQFGQPLAELNLDLPPRRIIKPEVGKLALFPSYMWHGTVPFIDEQPRISIAFDMQPKA